MTTAFISDHQAFPIIETPPEGTILWLNDEAARLLHIGRRAAVGRNLLTFFDGGRQAVTWELARAVAGHACEFDASLRPRERRPFPVRIDVAVQPDRTDRVLEWIIEAALPIERSPTKPRLAAKRRTPDQLPADQYAVPPSAA